MHGRENAFARAQVKWTKLKKKPADSNTDAVDFVILLYSQRWAFSAVGGHSMGKRKGVTLELKEENRAIKEQSEK